jgi:hypothetical protein
MLGWHTMPNPCSLSGRCSENGSSRETLMAAQFFRMPLFEKLG